MPLIGTLTSGVTALNTFSKGLEVIGGNIANVNTTGYKSNSASFADTFSNTVGTASGQAQIGSGVQLNGVATDFKQGNLNPTGKTTDLAISGNGYFIVSDVVDASGVPAGPYFATRDGNFHFDAEDRLVTAQGKFVLSADGTAIDITHSGGTLKVKSYSFGSDGTISVTYDDNSALATPPQVGLLSIVDQTKLVKQGSNLYDFSPTLSAAFDPADATDGMKAPNTTGLGKIQSGALEQSNVDLTAQFADLITTQRSFQAGSRLVTVSDSVLEDIVNLKRS